MKFLCSLLLVFSVGVSASLPAAEIDTAAVLRCGNMVQHVNGIQQSAADVAMEALAPPQTKADKWFVTVVTIKGCGLCTKLKDDWQKNANLSALANPEDPERSWANFHYYDYQDASQTWRFAAKKGTRLLLEVNASRLDSPMDSTIEILDATGRPLPRAVLRATARTFIAFRDHDSRSPGIRLETWSELAVNDFLLVGSELLKFVGKM